MGGGYCTAVFRYFLKKSSCEASNQGCPGNSLYAGVREHRYGSQPHVDAMNCPEVQEQLSAYHDGELKPQVRSRVAAHVASCDDCAKQLSEFESYSEAFKKLPQPEAPPSVWAGIASESVQSSRQLWLDDRRRPQLSIGRLSLAASVMLMMGIGFWMVHQPEPFDSHQAEFAMTMDHYLKTLARDPDEAEQFLLDKYNGQTVNLEDAVRLVGYRPAVASGLPEEYTLASTSIMKMPCCTCFKAVCKRQDGSTLVLFEHDDEETEWFGERPSSMAHCGDTECCLVDLDSSIAATWKRGSRWVTAVGIRDAEEVSELVTWLDSKVGSEVTTL